MPLFEYKCLKCEKKFEFLSLFGIEEEIICPECGGRNIEKQLPLLSRSANSRTGKGGSCCGTAGGCAAPKRCCES